MLLHACGARPRSPQVIDMFYVMYGIGISSQTPVITCWSLPALLVLFESCCVTRRATSYSRFPRRFNLNPPDPTYGGVISAACVIEHAHLYADPILPSPCGALFVSRQCGVE